MAPETFGALSMLPPLLAIGLAIVTRKAVLSLFLGIWSGGFIKAGGPAPLADPVGWLSGVVDPGFGLFPAFDWIVSAVASSSTRQSSCSRCCSALASRWYGTSAAPTPSGTGRSSTSILSARPVASRGSSGS